MNLDIVHEKTIQGHHLALKGELDAYTAPRLKEKLLSVVGEQDQKVAVELSDLAYMDSTGLGVLIGALKASQKSGTHLQLLNPQERIHRLFSITGLDHVMDIQQGEEE